MRERVGSVAVEISRRIRAWAAERNLIVAWGRGRTWGTYYPNVDHAGARYPTFSVSTAGKIEIIFRDLGAPFDDLATRRQLAARLNTIPTFRPSTNGSRPGRACRCLRCSTMTS